MGKKYAAILFAILIHISILELILGGKGYLFWLSVDGFKVSLRMILFAILSVSWILFLFVHKTRPAICTNKIRLPFFLLSLSLIIAGIVGVFVRHYPLLQVFSDANNWAFLLYVPILLDLPKAVPLFTADLKRTITVGLSFLAAKAWFFFTCFALAIPGLTTFLYTFERDTGGGQMAPAAHGLWRIYFWPELYLLPVLFFLLSAIIVRQKIDKKKAATLILVVATLVLTLFRSFWAGAIVGYIAWVFLWCLGRSKKEMWQAKKVFILVPLFAILSWFSISILGTGLSNLGGDRPAVQKHLFTANEPGVQNRINQLKPLLKQIQEHPVLGSGFGTTITYNSLDLRNFGLFKTSALEWGWLDMAMEIGLVGVAAYLWLLSVLILLAYKKYSQQTLSREMSIAIVAGIVAIAATHMVSPFLNHPIGFGYLAVTTLLLTSPQKQTV